jgi:hypothetical protein
VTNANDFIAQTIQTTDGGFYMLGHPKAPAPKYHPTVEISLSQEKAVQTALGLKETRDKQFCCF